MTIDEFMRDIAPKMCDGYIAMNKNGDWRWFIRKPYIPKSIQHPNSWFMRRPSPYNIKSLGMFIIAPVDDWEQSLRKVGCDEQLYMPALSTDYR